MTIPSDAHSIQLMKCKNSIERKKEPSIFVPYRITQLRKKKSHRKITMGENENPKCCSTDGWPPRLER